MVTGAGMVVVAGAATASVIIGAAKVLPYTPAPPKRYSGVKSKPDFRRFFFVFVLFCCGWRYFPPVSASSAEQIDNLPWPNEPWRST